MRGQPGADIRLTVGRAEWMGLGEGHGHLRARKVEVEAGGRRGASRPRRAVLWLPAAPGGIEVCAQSGNYDQLAHRPQVIRVAS
jgi:hypothetical protein